MSVKKSRAWVWWLVAGLGTVMSFFAVGAGLLIDGGEGLVSLILGEMIVDLIAKRNERFVWRIVKTLIVFLYSAGLAGLWYRLLCVVPRFSDIKPQHCHVGAVYATMFWFFLVSVLVFSTREIFFLFDKRPT